MTRRETLVHGALPRRETARAILSTVVRGVVVLALAGITATVGLAARPADAPASAPASKPAAKILHLRIDRAKRQVIVDAVVSVQEGALEFLLATAAKDYESLLITRAAPSSLHAGLLALGLTPGKPAQWSRATGKEPVFVPPQGAMLKISVRWKGKDGAMREAPVTDWLVQAGTKEKVPAARWVFVGSGFLDDGRYWADAEGHHISVANFASSVIDVPFESSDKTAMLEFAANASAVPRKGTPVKLVLTAVEGAERAAVARVFFQVDRFGRIMMDGQPIIPERIGPAIKRFLARHARGAAQVRVDPRALLFDQQRIKAILDDAGLTDVTFYPGTLGGEVLPRTSAEAAQALAWWKGQFAKASELIVHPAEDVAETLKQIQRERERLEQLAELWGDYAAGLKALIKEHSTQQGGGSGPDEED